MGWPYLILACESAVGLARPSQECTLHVLDTFAAAGLNRGSEFVVILGPLLGRSRDQR